MDTPARKRRFAIVSAILCLGAVCLAAYVLFVIRSAHASNQPGLQERSLGLTAKRIGDELELAWDTQSPRLQTAPEANLVIDDGPHKTQLLLTQSQIREGHIRYAPYTGMVVFNLSAFDRNHKSEAETLQVLQSSPPDDTRDGAEISPPVTSPKSVPGSMVVHGYVERGTPVDVRIPVNSQGRPLEATEYTTHKPGGVLHHLSQVGKAPARLWPFRRREEPAR